MRIVSLFSGAAGMDLGFLRAGHEIVWANDVDKDACSTYEANIHVKPVQKDIRKVRRFPTADVVIGCNPCQGFSSIGTRNPKDKRNYLYRQTARCLKQVMPKFFVTENVPGLLSLYGGRFFKLMLNNFRKVGYRVSWSLLNAKDYGVPQDRKRVFIVGVRKDLSYAYEFPVRTHGPGFLPYVSLRKAIGDLPSPKSGEYWDSDSFSYFYMSRNRRRAWDDVSFTIQAWGRHVSLHPSCPPMKEVGKDRWVFTGNLKRYRRLSVRECSRIQTFPDDFIFKGNLASCYRQIGNAVPPLLAFRIALSLNALVNEERAGVGTPLKVDNRLEVAT